MFEGCDRIVGGRGTQWDPEHVDAAYAHVDGGTNNPGYLTDPYAEPSESEAWFDGLTAWVYGDATLDDAFEEVGREEALRTIAAIVWEGTGALTAEQMQGITNPNLLVYVTEASKAPAGVQNIIVNGTGRYVRHSSLADCGVTGRKLAVDLYGGNCRIGGGSPWTKDGSKADLTLNIHARKLALDFMRQNRLRGVHTAVSCSIGSPEIEVSYQDGHGHELKTEKMEARPSELIRKYGLDKPIFTRLCREGLFHAVR